MLFNSSQLFKYILNIRDRARYGHHHSNNAGLFNERGTLMKIVLMCVILSSISPEFLCTQVYAGDQPPVITTQPEDKTTLEDDSVFLSCFSDIESDSDIVYTWSKDGTDISYTGRRYAIDSADRDDTGLYRCAASNDVGSIMSETATLTVAYLDDFSTSVTSSAVQKGQAAILSCPDIDSAPSADISWLDVVDGSEISSNLTHVVTIDNRMVLLSTDRSVYQYIFNCYAINDDTNTDVTSGDISLIVTDEDSQSDIDLIIIVPPQDTMFTVDDVLVKMECIVNAGSLEDLTISWSKDGTPIVESSVGYSLVNYNRVLQIYSPDDNSVGTYQCSAELSDVTVISSATLSSVSSPEIISYSGLQITADYSSDTTISCSASGSPSPDYTWYKDSALLVEGGSTRMVFSFDGGLTLTDVEEDDAGCYQCVATNDYGEAIATCCLSVESSDPSIVDPPTDTSVIQGDSVRMVCEATGAPQPTITWYKDDVFLADSDSTQSSTISLLDTGDLVITQAIPDDTGEYTCEAENYFGTAEASAVLTVYMMTAITTPPTDQEVILAYTAQFSCVVSHDEDVTVSIQWLLDDDTLDISSSRITVSDEQLQITEVRTSDMGTYTCKVTSLAGNDTANAILTVLKLPGAPTAVTATLTDTRSVYITWAAGSDGGITLTQYIIQMSENGGDWEVGLENIEPYVNDDEPVESATVTGLTPSNSYQFRVVAESSLGLGPASSESESVTIPIEPPSSAPQTVTATAISISDMTITWVAPPEDDWNGDLSGYIIRYRVSGYDPPWITVDVSEGASITTQTLTDLITFTEYEITVAANNSAGEGVYSDIVYEWTLEGVPDSAPIVFGVEAASSQSLTVSWTMDLDTLNGDLEGYKITATSVLDDTDSQTITYTPQSSQELTATVSDLSEYTPYSVTVLCYTGGGDGPLSDIVYAITAEDLPGFVSNMKFLDLTGTSLRVVWEAPSDPNGVITGYILRYSEQPITGDDDDEEISDSIVVLDNDTLSYTIDDLLEQTVYTISVAAETSVGNGTALSGTVNSGIPPSLPEKPAITSVSEIEATSLLLEFYMEYSGDTTINVWTVKAIIGDVPEWQDLLEIYDEPDIEQVYVNDLIPYTEYTLCIDATNVVGSSGCSEPSDLIVTETITPSSNPSDVTLLSTEATSLTVKWSPIPESEWNGAGFMYQVGYRESEDEDEDTDGGGTYTYLDVSDSYATSYNIINLHEYTYYEVKVKSSNQLGDCDDEATTVTERTQESVPEIGPPDVTATVLSSTSITVTWGGIPEDEQNGYVTGYNVRYEALYTDIGPLVKDVGGNQTLSTTLTGLEKYTLYNISVSAYTRVGDGTDSDSVLITTQDDLPGHPTNVRFCTVTLSLVTLCWDPPSDSNGNISDYHVSYRKNSSVTWIGENVGVTPIERNYTAPNLHSNNWYYFTVAAMTSKGWGSEAEVVVYTMDTDHISPSTPTSVSIIDGGITSTSILVSIDFTNELNLIRYLTIEMKHSTLWEIHEMITLDITLPTTSTHTITGLTPYTEYHVRVKATNDYGSSSYRISTTTVETLSDVPTTEPVIDSVTSLSTDSVEIVWEVLSSSDWNSDTSSNAGYYIRYRQLYGSSEYEQITIDSSSTTTYTLTDLDHYYMYELKVLAYNSEGEGPASRIVAFTGEAAPTTSPDSLTVYEIYSTHIVISWSPPQDSDDILGYEVKYWISDDDDDDIDSGYVVDGSTSLHVTSLQPYTTYTSVVSAYNSAGPGPDSSSITFTTKDDAPGSPSDMVFTVYSGTELLVSWDEPDVTNGVITGYEIIYQPIHGDGSGMISKLTDGDTSSLYCTDLIEDYSYVFGVRARTAIGYGPLLQSNTSTSASPYAPPTPSQPEVGYSNRGAIVVKWSEGDDRRRRRRRRSVDAAGYAVMAKSFTTTNEWDELGQVTSGATSYTIDSSDLVSNTPYQFAVASYSADGYRSWLSDPSETFYVDESETETQVYDEFWFPIIIALVGLVIILCIVAVLISRGRSKRYPSRAASRVDSQARLHHDDIGSIDSGGFSTFEMNRRGASSGRPRKNHLPKPPVPRPGSVQYSDDELDSKCGAGVGGHKSDHSSHRFSRSSSVSSASSSSSSTLTEKPSDYEEPDVQTDGRSSSSGSESQGSDEDTDTRSEPSSFVNHYAESDPRRDTWRQDIGVRNTINPAYIYSDSERDSFQEASVMTNHMVAGSRAPINGFSSFV